MDFIELEAGEKILWQGRPAPRCYTFQYWKQALLGSVLFLVSSFWLMLAIELIDDGQPFWLACLPLPLIIGGFIFGPLQILLARWRWPKIFYRLTDKRLCLSQGRAAQLSNIIEIKMKKQGEHLASLRILAAGERPLILHCIEQPESLLSLLDQYGVNVGNNTKNQSGENQSGASNSGFDPHERQG